MKTIADFVGEQVAWSVKTFGPGERKAGIIQHIAIEHVEDPDEQA